MNLQFEHPLYTNSNLEYQKIYSKILSSYQFKTQLSDNIEILTSENNVYNLPSIIYLKSSVEKNDLKKILSFFRNLETQEELIIRNYGVLDLEMMHSLCLELNKSLQLVSRQIINLGEPIENIRQNFRKSYKSLINQQLKKYSVNIIHKNNVNKDEWEEFRLMHITAAGRETRDIKTWECQFKNIMKGEAFLVTCRLNNEMITGGYFICSKNEVYYGVAASKKDEYGKYFGSHSMILTAILYSKTLNKKRLILSEDLITGDDEKLNQIIKFKRGFGPKQTPIYQII